MTTTTAFRFVCPECEGAGEGETTHPDPTQRTTYQCPACYGTGTVTLRSLAAYDDSMAQADDYTPGTRVLVPAEEPTVTDLLAGDPWAAGTTAADAACHDALAAVYGTEQADALMALEPPC